MLESLMERERERNVPFKVEDSPPKIESRALLTEEKATD